MVEGTQNHVLLEMIERTGDIQPGGIYDNCLQLFKGCHIEEGLDLFWGVPADTSKNCGQKVQLDAMQKVELSNNLSCSKRDGLYLESLGH